MALIEHEQMGAILRPIVVPLKHDFERSFEANYQLVMALLKQK